MESADVEAKSRPKNEATRDSVEATRGERRSRRVRVFQIRRG